jgi:AcrR family transcriptional regulator
VVAGARVSRNTFYEFFGDKQDCFLAASDEVGTEILERMYAQAAQPSWELALREGIRDYLQYWRERPHFAAAYLGEMAAAGRRAQEQRDRAYERFARVFEALAARARDEHPELPPLPPLVPRLITAGVTELLASEVRAGRLDELDGLADGIYEFISRAIAPAG